MTSENPQAAKPT